MQKVFVLDAKKQPLAPTHPARARQLLKKGKAAVYRRYPFTIILKREVEKNAEIARSLPLADSQPFRLKIDPGSKTTGMAILNDSTGEVVWAAELQHRGWQIKAALDSRRAIRRSRRHRKTRYRKPRFNNRKRPKGWLPPSLMSRVHNIQTWVARLRRYCPITAVSMELAKFDTQAMENPEVSGVEYQQGELFGYEVREYLLEKFGHKCVYCGAENVPLQVEHIVPKTRKGSNRISNLTIACVECNQRKGNQTAEEFGHPEVQAQAEVASLRSNQEPLRDAAAVNATRWEIYRRLQATSLPIEIDTGGRTKFNRTQRNLPKTHWLDAVCVGKSTPANLKAEGIRPLFISATGRGSRQMCRVNRFGFPRTSAKQFKRVVGFQTGDMVKAVVPKGKNTGTYIGRVAIRTSGSFNLCLVSTPNPKVMSKQDENLKTDNGTIQGVSYRYCRLLQHTDGYNYKEGGTALPPSPFNGKGFRA